MIVRGRNEDAHARASRVTRATRATRRRTLSEHPRILVVDEDRKSVV
jgi:hypothetical protein